MRKGDAPLSAPVDFELSFPEEPHSFHCAFLCDDNGQVIGDVGERLLSSNRSTATQSLARLIMSATFMDFLEAVRVSGANVKRELRIRAGRSEGYLLLHGSVTPFGIVTFVTLTPNNLLSPDSPTAAKPLSRALHDLKNPIGSIISACEYLAFYSEEDLNPDSLQMITEIAAAARTVLALSDRIADLTSHIANGQC